MAVVEPTVRRSHDVVLCRALDQLRVLVAATESCEVVLVVASSCVCLCCGHAGFRDVTDTTATCTPLTVKVVTAHGSWAVSRGRHGATHVLYSLGCVRVFSWKQMGVGGKNSVCFLWVSFLWELPLLCLGCHVPLATDRQPDARGPPRWAWWLGGGRCWWLLRGQSVGGMRFTARSGSARSYAVRRGVYGRACARRPWQAP